MTEFTAPDLLMRVFEKLDISPDARTTLCNPARRIEAAIPVRRDDGSLSVYRGYRVQYDTTLGPAKGGIRFHPDVDEAEATQLAFWMTIKCALMGLPYGGGKGGVAVDPRDLSPHEVEALARGYIRAMADDIGPNRDIPAPDVNTNARIMGWMADEYSNIRRARLPGVITGKPVELGGSEGRVAATGRGALIALKDWVERQDRDPGDITVAVQGFGNAGSWFARLAHEAGFKIVAVSDSSGALYKKDGFDPEPVWEQKRKDRDLKGLVCGGGELKGGEDFEALDGDELLALDVDVLALAAMENAITGENVGEVQAGLLLEIANGPVDAEAQDKLDEKGVTVIPDVLANAGGVTVSYYEWVQNQTGDYWSAEEVEKRLTERMHDRAAAVYDRAEKDDIPLREAAYGLAVERIAGAIEARGDSAYFGG